MITAYDPFINMWFLTFIIFLPILIAAPVIIKRRKKSEKKDTVLVIVAVVAFLVLEVLVLSKSILYTEYTFDNPIIAEKSNEELKFSEIQLDPDGLENVLKDGADFDSVRMYFDDKSYDKLSKGDFVEFVALKDSDRVDGLFYYTEDDLVVVYSVDESLSQQKVEIPTKS